MLNHEARFAAYRQQVIEIASALAEKKDIPMVAEQMALILEIQSEDWWQDVTLPMLERVRKRLRDLVKFIDKTQRRIVYTDFEDEIGAGKEVDVGRISSAVDVAQYRQKVLAFLKAHENHIAIRKVRMGEPLTATDLAELDRLLYQSPEIGGKAAFERAFGTQKNVGSFVRTLVGLDRAAAQKAFAEFLDGSRHTVDQIRFVGMIIDHLTRNGAMDPALLYESPYTDASPTGLDGVFDDASAERIVSIISRLNESAGTGTAG